MYTEKMRDRIYYTDIRKNNYKYRLSRAFEYQIPKDLMPDIENDIITPYVKLFKSGLFRAEEFYCWDGCSGAPDTKKNLRASVFHDPWYQLHRLGMLPLSYRKYGDKIFHIIMLEDDFMFADQYYWFVRRLGEKYAKPKNNASLILTAP